MVLPERFISVAEDAGFITAIGKWVVGAACRRLRTWQDMGITDVSMSVNVSARQFAESNLFSMVADAMEVYSLRGQQLCIEVTESLMIQDRSRVIATLSQLKRLGVRTSIDDFGTGYSSLSYLQQLPADQIKIDKSFVRDVLTDPNDAAIARAIIALGHSLGLSVIAEGVETAEQFNFLSTTGCDMVQGYYLFPPLEATDAALVLREFGGNGHATLAAVHAWRESKGLGGLMNPSGTTIYSPSYTHKAISAKQI
jgi:EAL domain-containing protein (putative c-di-GMP-specific phosphodiesterase class I)